MREESEAQDIESEREEKKKVRVKDTVRKTKCERKTSICSRT